LPSKLSYVGLAILVIGALVAIVGAVTPVSKISEDSVTLINTAFSVDPNDYATQNLQMTGGQSVSIALSIKNQSIFTFDIMNQTQYYVWYGCAPKCHQPLLGGQGTYFEQANETTPYLVNVTVTPSSPYAGNFSAPFNGTYYFVFDNSIGSSWSSYLNRNASGNTVGNFALSTVEPGKNYSVNWIFVSAGSALMLAGGSFSTLFWKGSKPKNTTR
jgi:hypothetical protein